MMEEPLLHYILSNYNSLADSSSHNIDEQAALLIAKLVKWNG